MPLAGILVTIDVIFIQLCFGPVYLGFVITVKWGFYAETFASRNSKTEKYRLFLPFPPQFYSSRTLHAIKMFTFPSASVIFFVDFSLVVNIYISIVTLFDCLISNFYWLQKVFTCEKCLSKCFDIELILHLCVMKFGHCCGETPKMLFIFQLKVALSTRHHFCSASVGKSAATVKQGGRRICFIRDKS